VPLSTSYWEWGHWWLEMLHRPFPLFLLARDVLSELAIVVPDDLPKWALQSLQAIYGFRSEQLVTYRREREVVHCRRALLPGMMLLPGRMRFHPLMNQFLDHVVRCCAEHTPPVGSSGLLFLTRRHADSVRTGQRMLSNTEAAEDLAASLGFEVVAPEQLDWRQQVSLLSRSRVVVGEHGSAMKSLLFAPAETIGVVLNYLNDSQAAIAALRGQQYVCIECEGYDAGAPENPYSVDLGRLEKVLTAAVELAGP
jgi:capsular polysaccharide biosynthesis protein